MDRQTRPIAWNSNSRADLIQVEVADGTVTLSGNVRSWLEQQAVVSTVSHAPGVQKVEDLLRISYN